MSTHNEIREINFSKVEAISICREAIVQIGWRIMNESSNCISIKEISPQAISFTWAAKIDIYFKEKGEITVLNLEGSIFGFGPIQSGHLKGQMGRFINIIKNVINSKNKINIKPVSLSEELSNLAKLKEKGLLSEEEFNKAKQKLLK